MASSGDASDYLKPRPLRVTIRSLRCQVPLGLTAPDFIDAAERVLQIGESEAAGGVANLDELQRLDLRYRRPREAVALAGSLPKYVAAGQTPASLPGFDSGACIGGAPSRGRAPVEPPSQ
jgi:hypothetical protein